VKARITGQPSQLGDLRELERDDLSAPRDRPDLQ
jgi:hypothetical protein